jgi:tRNA1(Val) A37 N6-methylase TrmN6
LTQSRGLSPSAKDYLQPAGRRRFSEDSVLLARFLPAEIEGRAADLGAGCGVVGLEALAAGRLRGLSEMRFVEIDPAFRKSLLGNLERTQAERPDGPLLFAHEIDWRRLEPSFLGGQLELIVVNPPYFPPGSSGPTRPDRASLRHETAGDLADLTMAAARLLTPDGGLCLSWPRRRLGALWAAAEAASLAPKRLTLPPRAGAALVLAELTPAPRRTPAGRKNARH